MDEFQKVLNKGIRLVVKHITTRQARVEECMVHFEIVKNTLLDLSTLSLGVNSFDIDKIKEETEILQNDILNNNFSNLSEVFKVEKN